MLDRKVEDLKILFTQEQIEQKTKELADEINKDFGTGSELVLICVLKGSTMFCCDLAKHLNI